MESSEVVPTLAAHSVLPAVIVEPGPHREIIHSVSVHISVGIRVCIGVGVRVRVGISVSIGIGGIHELWVRGEPAGYVTHVTEDPLPGVPFPKKILLTAALAPAAAADAASA